MGATGTLGANRADRTRRASRASRASRALCPHWAWIARSPAVAKVQRNPLGLSQPKAQPGAMEVQGFGHHTKTVRVASATGRFVPVASVVTMVRPKAST